MTFSVLPSEGTIANNLKNMMGLMQLITATIGAIISILIIKIGFRKKLKNF